MHALLWLAQDDRASALTRLHRQWQTGQTDDAADGHSSDLPQEKQQCARQRAHTLSLSLAQPADYACQPSLERRHHLCTSSSWIHVPGRCHRLAQSLCARLAALQYLGRPRLCVRRSARVGPRFSTPTRAHSSRPMPSPPACSQAGFKSSGMGAAAPSTTSSANDCGAASNMRKSIFNSMKQRASCGTA